MTTIPVTGADRSIGLEPARLAAGRGRDVVGTARDPEAAAGLLAVVDGLGVGDGGRFFDRHGEELPW